MVTQVRAHVHQVFTEEEYIPHCIKCRKELRRLGGQNVLSESLSVRHDVVAHGVLAVVERFGGPSQIRPYQEPCQELN
jgi:hypothetical protein